MFLKDFDLGFKYIEVPFTDSNSKPLGIEIKSNRAIPLNLKIECLLMVML